MTPLLHTLSKEERLSGKTTISALLKDGKWGTLQPVKYCFLYPSKEGCNRILVCAPKKYFKRAVKRNLIKRRIREAYRLQKEILKVKGIDIMFYYNSQDIVSFQFLFEVMGQILKEINGRANS